MSTKITVNEKVYDSVDAMPPDVREIYEKAMSAANAAVPVVKHSEIKVTFQMGGSPPKFHTRPGPASAGETPSIPLALVEHGADAPIDAEKFRPIEPTSTSIGLQVLLVVGAGLAIGLAFWYWSAH